MKGLLVTIIIIIINKISKHLVFQINLKPKTGFHIVMICRNCHILAWSCYISSDFLDVVADQVFIKHIDRN